MKAAALILALLPAAAMAGTMGDDSIAGFSTAELEGLWPDAVQGLPRTGVRSVTEQHVSAAQYGGENAGAKVLARLYGWPLQQPQPVTDPQGPQIGMALQVMAEAIEAEQGEPPEAFALTSQAGQALRCLRAEQQPGVILFMFCATPVKGRILEVQHVAMMQDRDAAALDRQAADLAGELADRLAAAN